MFRFGERLKAARRRAKMTQADAAKAIEAHPKTLGRWERGVDFPTFHTGCRIANILKVNVFYLAGIHNEPIQGTPLQPDEAEIMENYRALSTADKALWRESLRDAKKARQLMKANCAP